MVFLLLYSFCVIVFFLCGEYLDDEKDKDLVKLKPKRNICIKCKESKIVFNYVREKNENINIEHGRVDFKLIGKTSNGKYVIENLETNDIIVKNDIIEGE